MIKGHEQESIQQLVGWCYLIQEVGEGKDGHPYVSFQTSNYGAQIEIRVMDNGFKSGAGYDGVYEFRFDDIGERTFKNCKEHLLELIKKVS